MACEALLTIKPFLCFARHCRLLRRLCAAGSSITETASECSRGLRAKHREPAILKGDDNNLSNPRIHVSEAPHLATKESMPLKHHILQFKNP